jgi:hypothetical protein
MAAANSFLDQLLRPTDPARVQGRTEALGNGLALGAGSRLGAAMQAGFAGLSGGDVGDTYNRALTENRDILDRQRAAEPKATLALEAAGGIPSAIATGGAAALGARGTMLARLAAAAKTGAKYGGFSGALGSRGDAGSLRQAADAGVGTLAGAALGSAGELAHTGIGSMAEALRPGLPGPYAQVPTAPFSLDPAAYPAADIPPERVAVLEKIREMQRAHIRDLVDRASRGEVRFGAADGRPQMGRGFPEVDVVDPDTGETLIPSTKPWPTAAEEAAYQDSIDAADRMRPKPVMDEAEHRRLNFIADEPRTNRLSRDAQMTERVEDPLGELFGKTQRRGRPVRPKPNDHK